MALTDIGELWGGTVERSADGVTYTTLTKVLSVKVPELTNEYKDRTNLGSSGRVRERGLGFRDPGEFSVTMLYTEAEANAAWSDQARDAGTYYRITLSNGDSFTFLAFVSVSIPEMNVTDDAQIVLSGQVSGVPLRTAAGSVS